MTWPMCLGALSAKIESLFDTTAPTHPLSLAPGLVIIS